MILFTVVHSKLKHISIINKYYVKIDYSSYYITRFYDKNILCGSSVAVSAIQSVWTVAMMAVFRSQGTPWTRRKAARLFNIRPVTVARRNLITGSTPVVLLQRKQNWLMKLQCYFHYDITNLIDWNTRALSYTRNNLIVQLQFQDQTHVWLTILKCIKTWRIRLCGYI